MKKNREYIISNLIAGCIEVAPHSNQPDRAVLGNAAIVEVGFRRRKETRNGDYC